MAVHMQVSISLIYLFIYLSFLSITMLGYIMGGCRQNNFKN